VGIGAGGRKSGIFNGQLARALDRFVWNPDNKSDSMNRTWCYLRAIEWSCWPVFLSQPLMPLLFCLSGSIVWRILIGIVIANTLWGIFTLKRPVNVLLAEVGIYFALLRFLTAPAAAVYLLLKGNYWLALAALVSPFAASYLTLINLFIDQVLGIKRTARFENLFLREMGYFPRPNS